MTDATFEQTRWSLADLLPATEGPELDRTLAELEAAVSTLEASREQLSPDMEAAEFQRLLDLVEQIATLSQRLGAYGYLWYAEDTQNQEALAFRGRMEKLGKSWRTNRPGGCWRSAAMQPTIWNRCAASSLIPYLKPRRRSSTSRTSTASRPW